MMVETWHSNHAARISPGTSKGQSLAANFVDLWSLSPRFWSLVPASLLGLQFAVVNRRFAGAGAGVYLTQPRTTSRLLQDHRVPRQGDPVAFLCSTEWLCRSLVEHTCERVLWWWRGELGP